MGVKPRNWSRSLRLRRLLGMLGIAESGVGGVVEGDGASSDESMSALKLLRPKNERDRLTARAGEMETDGVEGELDDLAVSGGGGAERCGTLVPTTTYESSGTYGMPLVLRERTSGNATTVGVTGDDGIERVRPSDLRRCCSSSSISSSTISMGDWTSGCESVDADCVRLCPSALPPDPIVISRPRSVDMGERRRFASAIDENDELREMSELSFSALGVRTNERVRVSERGRAPGITAPRTSDVDTTSTERTSDRPARLLRRRNIGVSKRDMRRGSGPDGYWS